MFFNHNLYKKIRFYINKLNPDVIHVNNLYVSPKAQYKALKGYKTFRTLRDYFSVCPKKTGIYNDYKICSGRKNNDCIELCLGKSVESYLKMYKFDNLLRLNSKYVKSFITPSDRLKNSSLYNGYKEVYCINDCIKTEQKLSLDDKIKFENKKYLYFGAINENKGIYKFIDSFNKYCRDKNHNIELNIVGNGSKENIDKLNKIIAKNSRIKYLGFLEHSQVMKFLEQVYCVVVPSLWVENYPNTVLEAMLTKCIVIGSNRGGIPEMINDCGIMFDILSSESIISVIDRSFKLSFNEYEKRIEKGIKYVHNHNSQEIYYKKINNIFNS